MGSWTSSRKNCFKLAFMVWTLLSPGIVFRTLLSLHVKAEGGSRRLERLVSPGWACETLLHPSSPKDSARLAVLFRSMLLIASVAIWVSVAVVAATIGGADPEPLPFIFGKNRRMSLSSPTASVAVLGLKNLIISSLLLLSSLLSTLWLLEDSEQGRKEFFSLLYTLWAHTIRKYLLQNLWRDSCAVLVSIYPNTIDGSHRILVHAEVMACA